MKPTLLAALLLIMAGCRSAPARPTPSDIQAELAILDRMEKDLGDAEDSLRLGASTLLAFPDSDMPERRELKQSIDTLDKAVYQMKKDIDAQRMRIAKMRSTRQ